MIHVDDAFGHWLAGFIDGEGCFRIHSQKRGDYYAPSFSLKLRDDDIPLLYQICGETKIGRVQLDTKGRGNSNPCAIWRVDSKEATEALVELLDRFPLRSRKARDYEVWRVGVVLRRTMRRGNRWHGQRDWTPMIKIKRELEQAREYVPPEGR